MVYTRTLRLRLVNGVHLNTEAEAGQWCTLEHRLRLVNGVHCTVYTRTLRLRLVNGVQCTLEH